MKALGLRIRFVRMPERCGPKRPKGAESWRVPCSTMTQSSNGMGVWPCMGEGALGGRKQDLTISSPAPNARAFALGRLLLLTVVSSLSIHSFLIVFFTCHLSGQYTILPSISTYHSSQQGGVQRITTTTQYITFLKAHVRPCHLLSPPERRRIHMHKLLVESRPIRYELLRPLPALPCLHLLPLVPSPIIIPNTYTHNQYILPPIHTDPSR